MDGIANVAKMQQSQVSTPETQGRAVEQSHQASVKQENVVKELQQESSATDTKINSKKDVEKLVKDLNRTLDPLNTSLKFGVDQQDVFYVSVIDKKTNHMIRRFPAEEAQKILPKMQEVNGVLFDSKG